MSGTRKYILPKVAFTLLLVMACFHTYFVITGGPAFPTTTEFIEMQTAMATIPFDTGGGVMRTMQNILDGFNIIVSIFLFGLPILSWLMLSEVGTNIRALRKLLIADIVAMAAFFFTSWSLLAAGGTIISGMVCLLLLISSFIYKN